MGLPTSTILAAPAPRIESLLLIGELFTDEHLAEMISHPLFCLGVDGYTASLDGPLDAVVGHPLCFAGHVHYLTHHVRRGRHAAARGGDPEDDVRCRRALRPLGPRRAARRATAADLVVLDLDRLADGSTLEHPLAYAQGVDEVLVNGAAVVDGGEHTGARPGPAPAARALT